MSKYAASTHEPVPPKRRQILEGARQVFSELGFERASVDLVAARAGVSKATIYHHYADKAALFTACVEHDAEEMCAALTGSCVDEATDVSQVLQRVGENLMRVMLSPAVAALYRHTAAEVVRLPGLGRVIFDRGLKVLHDTIASYLEAWHRRGALRIDDAHTAAVQFVALCQADLVIRSRLAILDPPADDAVRGTVAAAVRTFVRAHAPEVRALPSASAGTGRPRRPLRSRSRRPAQRRTP